MLMAVEKFFLTVYVYNIYPEEIIEKLKHKSGLLITKLLYEINLNLFIFKIFVDNY